VKASDRSDSRLASLTDRRRLGVELVLDHCTTLTRFAAASAAGTMPLVSATVSTVEAFFASSGGNEFRGDGRRKTLPYLVDVHSAGWTGVIAFSKSPRGDFSQLQPATGAPILMRAISTDLHNSIDSPCNGLGRLPEQRWINAKGANGVFMGSFL